MATSVPGEIMDVLVNILESAPVQATLVQTIKNGEVAVETIADKTIENIKANGVLGLVVAAGKGTVEKQLNDEIASWPPEKVASVLTALAQREAKNLGG